jgi:benzoyl-CoA reductase subunit BamC
VKKRGKKKIIKEIKVDIDKCTGCRSCELACSAFHSVPRYSSLNPSRARIRVFMDELQDAYVPVRAGEFTKAECSGRSRYVIDGKEYSECAFCPASCPSRDWFREPDSDLPLKCDMCKDVPPLDEPMCVQACKFDALTYEEKEEAVEVKTPQPEEMKSGIDALIKKYGAEVVRDAVNRAAKR